MTRDGVLNGTAELFFHYLRDDTDTLSLVCLLACALEFTPVLAGKRRVGKKARKDRQARIEELYKQLDIKRAEIGIEVDPIMRQDSSVNVTTATARRARALLWAHLMRMDLEDKELREGEIGWPTCLLSLIAWVSEQLAVLRLTPSLLIALSSIALAHNWLSTSLLVVKLQAALVQALPPFASPLAQLPGVDHETALELEIVKGADGRRWCDQVVKKGLVLGEAKTVAEHWPRLEITDAEFRGG